MPTNKSSGDDYGHKSNVSPDLRITPIDQNVIRVLFLLSKGIQHYKLQIFIILVKQSDL